MGKFKIREILLFAAVFVLTGCAREYECDVGTMDDDGEFHSIGVGGPGIDSGIGASITVNWPDGEREAKERCVETYNDTLGHTLIIIVQAYRDDPGTFFHCLCEEAN